MSQMISILDDQGNINANQLSKEIKASLEFDIRYRQVDNMKKRAIRSSTNYEEFQALVACAHLKKLSKKEVESLSQVKQGWKKTATSKIEKATILEYEYQQEQLQQANSKGISIPTTAAASSSSSSGKKKKKVKSMMELERDLRRIPTDQDKWKYLHDLGLVNTLELLKSGTEIDLMEEIVRLISLQTQPLISAKSSTEGIEKVEGSELVSSAGDIMQSEEKTVDSSSTNDVQLLCEWFEGIAKLGKFSLLKQFTNKQLFQNVHTFLSLYAAHVTTETLELYS